MGSQDKPLLQSPSFSTYPGIQTHVPLPQDGARMVQIEFLTSHCEFATQDA